MDLRPDVMERLGLAPGADERQVKRAYARELKLIDQERDLEGFQHLRACYEAALAWAALPAGRSIDSSEPEEDAGASVPRHADAATRGAGAPDPTPSWDVGEAVFDAFCARIPDLAALRDLKTRSDRIRMAPWIGALHDALDDPRMLSLDARLAFEGRVAALLAGGWQPGHHLLLMAAAEVFGWDRDPGSLQRLGYPGEVLEAVFDQRAMFMTQDVLARELQRQVLSLMREPDPDADAVKRWIGHLRFLASYFPEMIYVVAPQASVLAWLERYADVPSPVPERPAKGIGKLWEWLRDHALDLAVTLACLFVMVFAFGGLAPSKHDAPAAAPRRSASAQVSVLQGLPVTDERVGLILQRVDYRPAAGAAVDEQRVKFWMYLEPDGSIQALDVVVAPADPAYAAAVDKAIRASAPFPPGRGRVFEFEFRGIPMDDGRITNLMVTNVSPASAKAFSQ